MVLAAAGPPARLQCHLWSQLHDLRHGWGKAQPGHILWAAMVGEEGPAPQQGPPSLARPHRATASVAGCGEIQSLSSSWRNFQSLYHLVPLCCPCHPGAGSFLVWAKAWKREVFLCKGHKDGEGLEGKLG